MWNQSGCLRINTRYLHLEPQLQGTLYYSINLSTHFLHRLPGWPEKARTKIIWACKTKQRGSVGVGVKPLTEEMWLRNQDRSQYILLFVLHNQQYTLWKQCIISHTYYCRSIHLEIFSAIHMCMKQNCHIIKSCKIENFSVSEIKTL